MQSLLKIPSCTGGTVCSWASLNLDQGAKVLTIGCGVSSIIQKVCTRIVTHTRTSLCTDDSYCRSSRKSGIFFSKKRPSKIDVINSFAFLLQVTFATFCTYPMILSKKMSQIYLIRNEKLN